MIARREYFLLRSKLTTTWNERDKKILKSPICIKCAQVEVKVKELRMLKLRNRRKQSYLRDVRGYQRIH